MRDFVAGGVEAVRWLPCCCAVVLRVPYIMWVCLSLLMGAKGLLHLCAGRASQLCQCVAQAGGTCKSGAEADRQAGKLTMVLQWRAHKQVDPGGADHVVVAGAALLPQAEVDALEQELFSIAGRPFNLDSPKECSAVIFDELGLKGKGVKKTKSGYYSTSM